jgi:hypothetical protein
VLVPYSIINSEVSPKRMLIVMLLFVGLPKIIFCDFAEMKIAERRIKRMSFLNIASGFIDTIYLEDKLSKTPHLIC